MTDSLTQNEQAMFDRINSWRLTAHLDGETVTVSELVDTDAADNRAYIKTHADSEVFCVRMSDVEIVTA